MIVATRYRDIPWEEVSRCVRKELEFRTSWETKLRGQPVSIMTPPVDGDGVWFICAGPFYRLPKPPQFVKGFGLGRPGVCAHIVEIGD